MKRLNSSLKSREVSMAVFEEEIIANHVCGSGKNSLRSLGLPEGTVKLTARRFLRAVMFA